MQETIQQKNRSELWNLSLRDLFYKYVRFLPLFVLSVAIALFGAYVYLRYAVPIYRVGGSLIIKSDQNGSNRSDKFEDVFINDKTENIQNEIEILRSKPLMQRVVDSLHLQFTYYARGKIKTVNVYTSCPFRIKVISMTDSSRGFTLKIKFLNPNEFRLNNSDQKYAFGQPFKNASGTFSLVKDPFGDVSGEYSLVWTPTVSIASVYAGSLIVNPKTPGTGIITINMLTTHPQMGADIINKLMQEYSLYTIEQKQEASDKILAFIDDRLDVTKKKLDSVKNNLVEFENRNHIIDVEKQTGNYFESISESDKFINEQNLELSKAESVSDYLRDKRNEYSKVPATLMLTDPTFVNLVGEYNKNQNDREQLLASNIPSENPSVKEVVSQIDNLRQRLLEGLKNIIGSMSSSIDAVRKKSQLSQAELQLIPSKQKELLALKQDVESIQGIFKYLQDKREETAITRASTISNSNIVDKSYPSSDPVKPNKRAIQILAVLLGLGIPAFYIFIKEILNDKVGTRFDIEKLTTTPILGEVGHSYSENVLVVRQTTRSMVAEQFRIIRSNLQYILNNTEKPIILVTSSFSGEGKSYVATNMGAVMSLAGKKTIILEFDIRKPKILSGLEIHKGPGITNFLVGKSSLNELIRKVPDYESLYILGCGPIPPNPAELLLTDKVAELFEQLRQNFDVIVIDTAPIGMVSDAMTLSRFADCTLYLVRQAHTFKKQVALIDEFYVGNKLPKISIIINDVKIKPGYGYYGYGRYGYGYGYGQGYGAYYEEEKPSKGFFERLFGFLTGKRSTPPPHK